MKLGKLALTAATLFAVPPTALSAFYPYTTSVDVYLDVDNVIDAPTGTSWDLSSAVVQPNCVDHLRGFVFRCSWYKNTEQFTCNVRVTRLPGQKDLEVDDPIYIYDAGWYTFHHSFYDDGSGVLAVDMEILQGDTLIKDWTLSETDVTCYHISGRRKLQHRVF